MCTTSHLDNCLPSLDFPANPCHTYSMEIKQTTSTMYSSTLNTDYTMYHEIIKRDGIDCAKIIQFKAGDYGYILDHNMSTSRGYKTVGDCKMSLYLKHKL